MKVLYLIAALVLAGHSGYASANQLRPMPLNQQAAKADAIVVGRAMETTRCLPHNRRCVHLADAVFLKQARQHKNGSTTKVMLDHRIAELQVTDCCESGKLYIMFLAKVNGQYVPLHGSFSVFEAPELARVPLE